MTYGALAAGEYVFEVTATTVDGRSSDAPASVRLTVETPWWNRLPVLVGGLVAIAFAAALVVKARERRLVAAHTRLEETVAERTDELRRLNEQLSELAITDALTGLPNRRSILSSAEEAFSLARRRSLPFSVAMIDFDHFKEINDALGHAEGDRLLAEGAQRMSECLRTEDAVGRYGGEEFLAVFPMTGPEGTFVVGERLRRAVSEVRLSAPAGGQTPGERATVSVGVASLVGRGPWARRPPEARRRGPLRSQAGGTRPGRLPVVRDRLPSPNLGGATHRDILSHSFFLRNLPPPLP